LGLFYSHYNGPIIDRQIVAVQYGNDPLMDNPIVAVRYGNGPIVAVRHGNGPFLLSHNDKLVYAGPFLGPLMAGLLTT
jgi:hypothetical protein